VAFDLCKTILAQAALAGMMLVGGPGGPAVALAEGQVVGRVDWGIWVDDDGCMHYWADGGLEGYMVPRRDPETGKPVCLKKSLCRVESTASLFEGTSDTLSDAGRDELSEFFRRTGAFTYAVYARSDAESLTRQEQRRATRRADAISELARGWPGDGQAATADPDVTRVSGERIEIMCFRW
jgi:hypothetical protein